MRLRLAVLAALFVAPSLVRAQEVTPAEFVRVEGAGFVLGTTPFVFAGANVDPLHGERERQQLEATLDAVRADGLTVVRAWALGEGPADAPARDREHVLFRAGPDGYIDAAYVALDRLLVAAKARGLRVMLTLANAWPDFGGVRQYLAWADLPTSGYGACDRFYADPRVRAAFLAHLDRLLGRVNSISGERYADDPTIFAWELMNESQIDSVEGALARRAFVAEVAAYVHARAARQLVASGVSGYGTRAERGEWLTICRLPGVDFCDSHFYPQGTDRVPDLRALQDRVDDRVQLAHFVAGKPIVFGELGFDTRAEHDGWLGAGRAVWFGRLLDRFARDRVDGAIAWIYQPWSGHARDFGIYVDRPDTDDVRRVLRRYAAAIPRRATLPPNPRLGVERGDALLYPAYQVLREHGQPRVEASRDGTTIVLPALHFDLARFERAGTFSGGDFFHAFGAGDGWFEWRFSGPSHPVASMTLRARLSSELPGTDAPPDAWSIVTVSLDGRELGALVARPDDGRGAIVELTVDDPEALRAMRAGPHRLRLTVPAGAHANGVCVYGKRTERAAADLEETEVSLRFAR